jgi:hypothetical protein
VRTRDELIERLAAYYPPVHLEPGEKRRDEEAAMNERYKAYRKAKGRSG